MNERHLIYRIIEYGLAHQFFKFKDLERALSFASNERPFIINTLIEFPHSNTTASTNHIMKAQDAAFKPNTTDWDYDETTLTLLPTAIFQYNDYLEIIEARKSAQEAKKLSWYAIWISIGLGVVQIIIGYLQLRTH